MLRIAKLYYHGCNLLSQKPVGHKPEDLYGVVVVHGFFNDGSEQGTSPCAIVETLEGTVETVPVDRLQFVSGEVTPELMFEALLHFHSQLPADKRHTP